jgi:hypothetical protein
MKHHKLSKTQQAVIAPRPTSAVGKGQDDISFTPSPDEVARRAYFAYENERSQPGQDVEHWLKAEADLIAEHNLTRVHGYHNQT